MALRAYQSELPACMSSLRVEFSVFRQQKKVRSSWAVDMDATGLA